MGSKVNNLVSLASKSGLDVIRFEFLYPLTKVRTVYHSYKRAGDIPVLEHCRDLLDFNILMSQWLSRGEVESPEYENFDDMISGELKRLKSVRF